MNPTFMEKQSRWVMRTVFRRNFDGFTDDAQRNTNWLMLVGDLVLLYVLLQVF